MDVTGNITGVEILFIALYGALILGVIGCAARALKHTNTTDKDGQHE